MHAHDMSHDPQKGKGRPVHPVGPDPGKQPAAG
jgi:hypothetical protein